MKIHTRPTCNLRHFLLYAQGSTVNMNLMGPVYNMVKHGIHSDRTLGISLFLGKCVTRRLDFLRGFQRSLESMENCFIFHPGKVWKNFIGLLTSFDLQFHNILFKINKFTSIVSTVIVPEVDLCMSIEKVNPEKVWKLVLKIA